MPIKSPPDFAELFASLKQGDREAKNYLFQILRERVLYVAKQYINAGEVEDVVQEAMQTLSEKITKLDRPEAVLPFCLGILRNKIGNALQRKQRIKDVPLEEDKMHDPHNPQSLMESGVQYEKIRSAIERVGGQSQEFRKIATLLGSGCSMQEIAEAFGDANKCALYSRIHRFRKRLKEVLKKQYDLEV